MPARTRRPGRAEEAEPQGTSVRLGECLQASAHRAEDSLVVGRSETSIDERLEELSFVEDELAKVRPLADFEARLVDGVARWKWLLVSAAYPHNVNGKIYSP